MATYLGHPPDVPDIIHGLDLVSATRTLNAITRAAIGTEVMIYGLNLLAATLALVAIIRSAIITPEIHADQSAENELNALLKKEQLQAVIIGCTLVLGIFFPLIALTGFIIVSIFFFVTPTISTVKATIRKR